MDSDANMSPTQALMIFGVMMLVMSAITLWAISNEDLTGSPGLGAVDFSEEQETNAIKVSVLESGSANQFIIEGSNGETKTLEAQAGASTTMKNVNSVEVYGVTDNERAEIDSYTASWAS